MVFKPHSIDTRSDTSIEPDRRQSMIAEAAYSPRSTAASIPVMSSMTCLPPTVRLTPPSAWAKRRHLRTLESQTNQNMTVGFAGTSIALTSARPTDCVSVGLATKRLLFTGFLNRTPQFREFSVQGRPKMQEADLGM